MKRSLLIVLLLFTFFVNAQNDCPPGNEKIWVKCNGVIASRCVSSRENCGCTLWAVDYYSSSNPNKVWGGDKGNTYQGVASKLQYTMNRPANFWSIPDGGHLTASEIYCDDIKLCASNATPNYLDIKDFRTKLLSIYDAFGLSMAGLADAYEKYKGYTGPAFPELTQTTTEYLGNIQEALKELKMLEQFKNNLNDKVTVDMEEKLNSFQNDYKKIQQSKINFESRLQNAIYTDPSWKKLPDGTYYKILANGEYVFWGGKEQIETVSAEQGKQNLLKHQHVKGSNLAK